MRRSDIYRLIGLTPTRGVCSEKKWYAGHTDAARAVREHNRRYVCEGVSEYWCSSHHVWHFGHRYKRWVADRMLLECIMWFKAWAETQSGRQRPR